MWSAWQEGLVSGVGGREEEEGDTIRRHGGDSVILTVNTCSTKEAN